MSGGQRYWNEDTQRWEDGTGGSSAAEPTLPAPAQADEGAPPPGPTYPAPPTSTPTVGTQAPTAGPETPTAGPDTPTVGPDTPTVGTQAWPGGGADSAWHGPGG